MKRAVGRMPSREWKRMPSLEWTNCKPGLTHREPIVDEADFERFTETVTPLLQPKRDVVWILCGRMENNAAKLKIF